MDDRGALRVVSAAFCAASSGTYLWTDVLDAEADRAHPTKRRRPIAAGASWLGAARAMGALLIVVGIALSAATGRWQTVLVIHGSAVHAG